MLTWERVRIFLCTSALAILYVHFKRCDLYMSFIQSSLIRALLVRAIGLLNVVGHFSIAIHVPLRIIIQGMRHASTVSPVTCA